MTSRIQQKSNIIKSDIYNKPHFKHRPCNPQLVLAQETPRFSFKVCEVKGLKGVNRLEENIWKTLKKKRKESSARRRSQAAITTACCSDGGDNACSGANTKLALWTSAHPVFLHLEPKAAEHKSLTSFKGVSRRSGKGLVQEGAGK